MLNSSIYHSDQVTITEKLSGVVVASIIARKCGMFFVMSGFIYTTSTNPIVVNKDVTVIFNANITLIDNSNIIMKEIIVSRNIDNYRGISLFRYDYLFSNDKINDNTLLEIENLKKIQKSDENF